MWNYHKTMKIYQETCDNFFRIFARNFSAHRGSNNKKRGTNSMKNQENWRKTKSWRVKGPNLTHRWIRISRTPLGRWIDPDPLNLDQTATNTVEWVGFDPTRFRGYIKGERIRFAHSLERFSLYLTSLLSFSLRPFKNPNPSLNLPRNERNLA